MAFCSCQYYQVYISSSSIAAGSEKCSFVSFATMPESTNRPTKFGIAIRPLKVSAMFQTMSIGETQPITMTIAKAA